MNAMEKIAKSSGKRIIEAPVSDFSDSDDATYSSKKSSKSQKKLCIDNQQCLEGVDLNQLFTPFEEDSTKTSSSVLLYKLSVFSVNPSSRKPEISGVGINIYSPCAFKISSQLIYEVDPLIKVFVPKGYIIRLMDIPYLSCVGLKIMQQDFEGRSDYFKLKIHFFNHTKSSINLVKGQCLTKIVLIKCENNMILM